MPRGWVRLHRGPCPARGAGTRRSMEAAASMAASTRDQTAGGGATIGSVCEPVRTRVTVCAADSTVAEHSAHEST